MVIDEHMSTIFQAYASKILDWIVAKYFDPDKESRELQFMPTNKVKSERCSAWTILSFWTV